MCQLEILDTTNNGCCCCSPILLLLLFRFPLSLKVAVYQSLLLGVNSTQYLIDDAKFTVITTVHRTYSAYVWACALKIQFFFTDASS